MATPATSYIEEEVRLAVQPPDIVQTEMLPGRPLLSKMLPTAIVPFTASALEASDG